MMPKAVLSTAGRSAVAEVTWYRIGTSALLITAIAMGFAHRDVNALYPWVMGALVIAAPPMLFFLSEAERPTTNAAVPRSRWLAILCSPWIPGGGRGALFVLLHLTLASLAMFLSRELWPQGTCRVFHVVVTAMFATIYSFLPTALARPWLNRSNGRHAVRITVIAFMLICVIIGGLLESDQPRNVQGLVSQVLSPLVMGNLITYYGARYNGHEAAIGTVVALTLFAVAINTPRMFRGVGEVAMWGDQVRREGMSPAKGAGGK